LNIFETVYIQYVIFETSLALFTRLPLYTEKTPDFSRQN